MTEPVGWRRVIGHDGVFRAVLDLWPPERAGKTRPLQAGYHAGWCLDRDAGTPEIESGPIDLVGTRSVLPGQRAEILIHPMAPEAWASVSAGTTVVLMARARQRRALGEAVITERVGVPAHAPLRLEPLDLSRQRPGSAALLVSDTGAPPAEPPTVSAGGQQLPLLGSVWSTAQGEQVVDAPATAAAEQRLAERLPVLRLPRDKPIAMRISGATVPTATIIAYHSDVDEQGIPVGTPTETKWGVSEFLESSRSGKGGWTVSLPAPGRAVVVVVMLFYPAPVARGEPLTSSTASWGFRIAAPEGRKRVRH
ncbi:hypothetical protein MF406_05440 [Georgenia sp. TF02-10]|uniref:hypothetical protein n=1 Tax=Georgenia sp. TF02-10 TaxID=2917725 RepID=UPI001FA80CDA|nr:hypothetical protein [Georgenia sp. TF02-10]UNX55689.1 hypothetical protein MF406_05440 [Georgenia sp. TF02-10]